MSTRFTGQGNIGSAPEFREFPNGNDEPRRLLRLNVYFDNSIPVGDAYTDRGGFWSAVEWWHADAGRFSELFQKGMRIMVDGRQVRDQWEDEEGPRVAFKIEARAIAILPYRVERVDLAPKQSDEAQTGDLLQ